MNAELIALFEQLRSHYEVLGDVYRERAMRTAVSVLKGLAYEINAATLEDFIKTRRRGIGPGIMDRIREYVETGQMAEVNTLRASIAATEALSGILGAGPSSVREWIARGVKSVASLRQAVGRGEIKLTTVQKWGVRYYEDLKTRIPRAEVATLGAMVKAACEDVMVTCFEITGSYRRGLADSGDVDILVCGPPSLLDQLALKLSDDPHYIATLSLGPERFTFLYMGHRCRQIDVLNVDKASFPAALLYFTGSYEFNVMMRGVAKNKGYLLNQHGLFKGRKRIPVASEEDIFRALGMAYRAPSERVI